MNRQTTMICGRNRQALVIALALLFSLFWFSQAQAKTKTIIYAATAGGLSISTDGGETFTNKTTDDGLGNNQVNSVFADGSTVYAATGTSKYKDTGGLSISTDGGETFTNKIFVESGAYPQVTDVFVDGNTIYAGAGIGLKISTDGGASFTTKTDFIGDLALFADGSTIYVGIAAFFSISTDGGASFTKIYFDGSENIVYGVFADGSTIYVATMGGLLISTDGGETFTNKNMTSCRDVYADDSTIYVATYGGLLISTDGGETFTNKSKTDGLGDNSVLDVFADGSTVYVATDDGLSISTDGGKTFTNKTTENGLGDNKVRGVYAVTIEVQDQPDEQPGDEPALGNAWHDSDGDGVPAPWEQGPNSDTPSYDGNGDGEADWEQENVASFHTWEADLSTRHYLTLAVPAGQIIRKVTVSKDFSDPAYQLSLGYGFFSFNIKGVEEGGSTEATLYLDGSAPKTYYKYGPTPDYPYPHWYEFLYDGATGAEIKENSIVLHFVDGQRGDHDLEANGAISDPGGPVTPVQMAVLHFPFLKTGDAENTGISLVNTTSYTVDGVIRYYGESGAAAGMKEISVPANAGITLKSEDLPGGAASAIVTADGILAGCTRYQNAEGKRCAWPADASPAKTASVPLIASGDGWKTGVAVFNPNDEPAVITGENAVTGQSWSIELAAKARFFNWLDEGTDISALSADKPVCIVEFIDHASAGVDRAALLLKDRAVEALYAPAIASENQISVMALINGPTQGSLSCSVKNRNGEMTDIPLTMAAPYEKNAQPLTTLTQGNAAWAVVKGTRGSGGAMTLQGVLAVAENDGSRIGIAKANAMKFKTGYICTPDEGANVYAAIVNPSANEAVLSVSAFTGDGAPVAENTLTLPAGTNITGGMETLLGGIDFTDITHLELNCSAVLYGMTRTNEAGSTEMLPVLSAE